MKKLLVVAAAAVIRHQYEGKYRKMAKEEGMKAGMPFSLIIKKLVQAGCVEKSQRNKLIDRYRWLSQMIH